MQTGNNHSFRRWSFLVFGAIAFLWALFNFSAVGSILDTVMLIFRPFIIGGILALILNIPSNYFERSFLKNKKLHNKPSLVRALSLVLSLIMILAAAALIILIVVPQVVNVVKMLIANIPYYQEQLNELVEKPENSGQIDLSGIQDSLNLEETKDALMERLPGLVNTILESAYGIVGIVTDIFLALVFSFYLIAGKSKLKERSKRFARIFLPKHAETIIHAGKLGVTQFQNFVSAQFIEAIILGALCALGLFVLRIPYAAAIGVLVGVTALIPVVGAFVGILIGAMLIAAASPSKVILFVVFLLILQQMEGNLIYPRVVGNKVGLPGMWVLVAIIVGGGLCGVAGMLLGVPIGSVIYILINERMEINAGSVIKKAQAASAAKQMVGQKKQEK